MFYYTYILQSETTNLFYTGFTSDLQRRLREHNTGKNTYTKNRGPFDLIYYEACKNLKDAAQREKYLKSGPGKNYLGNRLKNGMNPVRTHPSGVRK